MDLFLEIGERWGATLDPCYLGGGVARPGRSTKRRERLAERGLELAREIGLTRKRSASRVTWAQWRHRPRATTSERGAASGGAAVSREAGNEANVAYCLEGLAAVAASEGNRCVPRRLWGAAEALLEKIEAAAYIYAPDRSLYQGRVRAARARLDEAAWRSGVGRGTGDDPERGHRVRPLRRRGDTGAPTPRRCARAAATTSRPTDRRGSPTASKRSRSSSREG